MQRAGSGWIITCARHAMRGGKDDKKRLGGGVGVSDHHSADYLRKVEKCERPWLLMIVQVHDGKVRAEVNRLHCG